MAEATMLIATRISMLQSLQALLEIFAHLSHLHAHDLQLHIPRFQSIADKAEMVAGGLLQVVANQAPWYQRRAAVGGERARYNVIWTLRLQMLLQIAHPHILATVWASKAAILTGVLVGLQKPSCRDDAAARMPAHDGTKAADFSMFCKMASLKSTITASLRLILEQTTQYGSTWTMLPSMFWKLCAAYGCFAKLAGAENPWAVKAEMVFQAIEAHCEAATHWARNRASRTLFCLVPSQGAAQQRPTLG
jgi:hypothetical protein